MSRPTLGITQNVIQGKKSTDISWGLEAVWSEFAKVLDLNLVPIIPTNNSFNVKIFDGYILSGGKMSSELDNTCSPFYHHCKLREEFEKDLLNFAMEGNRAILGICRGFQMMNLNFGGSITKVDDHVGKDHLIFPINNGHNVKFPPVVNSYHNYAIPSLGLGSVFEALAVDSDGNIEFAKHESCEILGVMWHPERDNLVKNREHNFLREFFHSD
jgi:putative glutamine amidotransferase